MLILPSAQGRLATGQHTANLNGIVCWAELGRIRMVDERRHSLEYGKYYAITVNAFAARLASVAESCKRFRQGGSIAHAEMDLNSCRHLERFVLDGEELIRVALEQGQQDDEQAVRDLVSRRKISSGTGFVDGDAAENCKNDTSPEPAAEPSFVNLIIPGDPRWSN